MRLGVGTTPDDGRIAGHVTARYAVWGDARRSTIRSHQRRDGALRPRSTLADASGEDAHPARATDNQNARRLMRAIRLPERAVLHLCALDQCSWEHTGIRVS